ncbi:MAG TPA: hypothetical protein VGP61_08925 [Gemmatimonadales bacterium]|nr:hypothetical protein [Gemmatimonadales bacterium]
MACRFSAFAVLLLSAAACSSSTSSTGGAAQPAPQLSAAPPSPDPRIGLKAGKQNAAEAVWNLRVLSKTPPPPDFVDKINSDLAFTGRYVIQGSFNGYQVWDITDPSHPTLKTAYVCPASQSDVSVYRNLLFVSGEDLSARLDCGAQGVKDTVSTARLRGIRIFDISDLEHPKNVGNVQTCRGSHTHSLLVDPKDPDNVYVYISGSSPPRSPNELAGCTNLPPDQDPNSPLLRLEVIKVPVAHPEQAAIATSPRVFQNLPQVHSHGETPEDLAASQKALEEARARGQYTAMIFGRERPLPAGFTAPMLDSIVKARNGTGAATAADSAALRAALPGIIAKLIGGDSNDRSAFMQCHDITLYPTIGLAGGACEGFGFLMDIHNPTQPIRLDAVADSNFSYWHSATFNNEGTKALFSDEWGGGGAPKCRVKDPHEWGADALFTIADRKLTFQSYYKLPVAQTPQENCVAHNGSLIPIPGRDVMVQAWYQGGISVFDWTDASHPKEIAFFDRGPVDSIRMVLAGSWSAYWYNGVIVSSEIVRGLDIFELSPSAFISQNEIDAAKTVHFDQFNTQGQQKFVWPPSFALARSFLDQLERSNGLGSGRINAVRKALAHAEKESGAERQEALSKLAAQLDGDASGSSDAAKVRMLAGAVRDLAGSKAP